MPVSNPSYFPDIRGDGSIIGITAGRNATGSNDFLAGNNAGANSTVADLIVIGTNAGAGAITDAGLTGSIIIGVGAAPVVTASALSGDGPLIVIGPNNLAQWTAIDSTVVIGSGILNGASSSVAQDSVFIGNNLFATAQMFRAESSSIIIGADIAGGSAGMEAPPQNAILIGVRLFATTNNNPYSGIVIGTDIDCSGSSGAIFGPNVIIGTTMTLPTAPTSSVLLGNGIHWQGAALAASVENIVIGANIGYQGNNNTLIGNGALGPNGAFGAVLIGNAAGKDIPTTAGFEHVLVIGSDPTAAAVPSNLIYGHFDTGTLILGGTVQGTNADVQGTNTVKLLNGTVGSADPVGGGYFYVTAGVLHWVDSSGTDTTVSSPAAPATGASVALFGASAANKPGATTGAGPVAWENRVIDGVSYESPLWAT